MNICQFLHVSHYFNSLIYYGLFLSLDAIYKKLDHPIFKCSLGFSPMYANVSVTF
jgi:hypothetical protein